MLKGIAASSGVAIAKVYKLVQPTVEIVKKDADPAVEVESFNKALEKTKADIEMIRKEHLHVYLKKNWQFLMLT